MSIKSDKWIKNNALKYEMIKPFEEKQIREGVISYGLSSYGYDITLADEFKIPENPSRKIIDPKLVDRKLFKDFKGKSLIIPAGTFVLSRSVEYFKIPRNVLTICLGKSTYARCGIIVNVTPFEPEWEGYATLSISNPTSNPVKIYANEGIAQVIFFESDEQCLISYKDKKGKYDGQKNITLPKF